MKMKLINTIQKHDFNFTSQEVKFIKNCNKSNLFSQKAFNTLIYG